MSPLASATLHGRPWPALPTVGPAAHGRLISTRPVEPGPRPAPGRVDPTVGPEGAPLPSGLAQPQRTTP